MARDVQWFLIFLVCFVGFECSSIQDVVPEAMRRPGVEYASRNSVIAHRPRVTRNSAVRRVWRPVIVSEDSAIANSDAIVRGYRGDDRLEGNEFYGKEASGLSTGEVGFYGRQGKKGSNQRVTDDAYRDNERTVHDDRSDAGFYNNASGAKQSHDIAKEQKAEQNYGRNGQGIERYGNKGGHRKGHRKSGFTNSYHKDESGNKSDFFDDSVDEGDHYVFDGRDGFFNDQSANKQHDNFQDGAFKTNQQGRKGQFDEQQNYNDRSGEKAKYARNQYSDDKLDYGQQKSGERFGQKSHGAEEQGGAKYYDNNGHVYEERRAPLPYVAAPVAVDPVPISRQGYYPVEEPVERYYASPAVKSREYYPMPSEYYPVKTTPYSGQVSAPGVAPGQYYLPKSEVYYPSGAY